MVRLMIADYVRRMFGSYVWCWLLLALIWPGVVSGMLSAGTGMAISMAIAFYIGPMVTAVSFARREVIVLPVSSRQIWLAKWIVATAGAAICTTAAKLTGMAGTMLLAGAAPMPSLVMLSGLLDFAYTGALIGMMPVLDAKPRGPLAARRIALWARFALAILAVSSVVWVFVFRAYLPSEWSDLSGVRGAVLVAALALTVAGYLYVPPAGLPRFVAPRDFVRAPAPRFPARGRPHPPATAARQITRTRVAILNRFSGVRYFLWREAVLWLFVVVAALVGLYAILLFGPARHAPSAIAELLEGFSQPLRSFPYVDGGWFPLLVVSCFPCFPPLPSRPSPRHLRTLPLSTSALNALVLAVPVVRWLTNCLVVGAMFVLLTGSIPQSFRWGVLLWFVAFTAFAHALQLRWVEPRRWFAAAVVVGLLIVTILARRTSVPILGAFVVAYPLNVLLAGGVALMGAALLNHSTLTRREAIYRPAPLE
jgi:hypothetical protein